MNGSFNNKFREEGTGKASWVALASYHIAEQWKEQTGNKVAEF